MLKQPFLEKNLPYHDIIYRVLVNDTEGRGIGEKNDIVRHDGKGGGQKMLLCDWRSSLITTFKFNRSQLYDEHSAVHSMSDS